MSDIRVYQGWDVPRAKHGTKWIPPIDCLHKIRVYFSYEPVSVTAMNLRWCFNQQDHPSIASHCLVTMPQYGAHWTVRGSIPFVCHCDAMTNGAVTIGPLSLREIKFLLSLSVIHSSVCVRIDTKLNTKMKTFVQQNAYFQLNRRQPAAEQHQKQLRAENYWQIDS